MPNVLSKILDLIFMKILEIDIVNIHFLQMRTLNLAYVK